MPIYRYRFDDGVEVDLVQSIHDEPFTWHHHPYTSKPASCRRVIQKPAVTFRGDGWARKES